MKKKQILKITAKAPNTRRITKNEVFCFKPAACLHANPKHMLQGNQKNGGKGNPLARYGCKQPELEALCPAK